MNVAIVEDNTSSAKNLQSHLARFEKETGIDIRSSVYKDGIDFIANYASQWDLVLMDIEMPVLDGMHTAKKLRELDKDVLLHSLLNMLSRPLKSTQWITCSSLSTTMRFI